MVRQSWHIHREAGTLTLSRRKPARFDVAVTEVIAVPDGRDVSLSRFAHQVRQDLWRALQGLRGFAPVVSVSLGEDGVTVKAGGAIEGKFPKEPCEAQIAAMMSEPARQARWLRHAARKPRKDAA